MRSLGFRCNPLRVLAWIEACAFLFAFAGDIVVAVTVRFSLGGAMSSSLKFYVPLAAVTAAAIFCIPHGANRRYWAIAAAVAGVCALSFVPAPGTTPLVLLAILAARLTFAFGLRGAAIAWGAALAALFCNAVSELRLGPAHLSLPEAIFGMYSYAVVLGLIFGMIGIMWLYAKRAALSAAASERTRIAFELHDSVGHALTTLMVQLQNAQRLSRQHLPASVDYVERATATAADVLADVRETVALLHDDAACAPAPLPMLLERLHGDFSATHNVELSWRAHLAEEPSGRVAMAVYRVVQEALTNIARHARAKRVQVSVLGRGGAIELLVRDDGIGFENAAGGHGLASMRARIGTIGGTLTITSRCGDGTSIAAQVPMEAHG